MKSFKITAAQGEITIRRIDVPKKKQMPSGYTAMASEHGHFIIGHSETGHHHVISAEGASVAVMDRQPEGMRILRIILNEPNTLIHLREFDTHDPIRIEPGEYEVRIGREYDPYAELARRQAD